MVYMVRKIFTLLAVVITLVVLFPPSVKAHCPLCTAAVGTGLVVARSFGVDDSIVGIWVGALVISSALWLNKFLIRRKKTFPFQKPVIIAGSFLITILPLYFSGLINFQNLFIGIDRLLFGTVLGCFLTLFSFHLSNKIRNSEKKVVIPFQSIILTMAILALSNMVLALIM